LLPLQLFFLTVNNIKSLADKIQKVHKIDKINRNEIIGKLIEN